VKNALIVATLLAALALGCGYLSYRSGCDRSLHAAAHTGDTMTWLRHEFHLNDQQFSAIEKLHREFSGACEEHCRSIRKAQDERDALRAASPSDPAALAAAETRVGELRHRCETSLQRHLEAVAALMSAEDGKRYLDTMRPLLTRFDHAGAPDLGLNSTQSTAHHEH